MKFIFLLGFTFSLWQASASELVFFVNQQGSEIFDQRETSTIEAPLAMDLFFSSPEKVIRVCFYGEAQEALEIIKTMIELSAESFQLRWGSLVEDFSSVGDPLMITNVLITDDHGYGVRFEKIRPCSRKSKKTAIDLNRFSILER